MWIFELLGNILLGVISGIPSKKNREINNKFKLLRNESWYIEMVNRHGNLFGLNHVIREFIDQKNIKNILEDKEKTVEFKKEFEDLIKKQKL